MPGSKNHQSFVAGIATLTSAAALVALILAEILGLAGSAWGVGRWAAAGVALAAIGIAALLQWRSQQPTAAEATSEDAPDERHAAAPASGRSMTSGSVTAESRPPALDPAKVIEVLLQMREAILLTDRNGTIRMVNQAAEKLIGEAGATLIGQSIDDWLRTDDSTNMLIPAVAKPSEAQLRLGDGSNLFVSYVVTELNPGAPDAQFVYAAQNIDDRKKAEQRIRYLARTDPLTRIANRMQFQHYVQQGIARARRAKQFLGLIYLDIDRFKDINDTFGHAAGDTALEIFSQRLLDALPEGAVPGRLAGDEFAVLVSGAESLDTLTQQLRKVARALLNGIGQPFLVQEEEIFMTTSLGVALYPRDGDNVIDLIRNADAALYHAKKAGGNCYEFYSPDMNVESAERLMIKSKLRRAFENDELRLHYQPKYGLKSGRIEGAEALVRWDQPDHGLLFPSDFIPLAEETNLIIQVGDWVLDKVCADYRRWQLSVPSPCRVSLNLSLRQLQQRRFLEKVRETFESHSVSPTCLELEITETTLMDDTDRTIRILDALYGMGLHLAIDDFGTGYSSLSALQQFPINTLKIDQSFVKDVAIDRDNAAIVRTIIQMGHSLGLEVVAEGVESEEQLAFLRREKCDFAQGHLFGDPMTADEFCQVLAADNEGTGKYRTLFG
jgi:diguanylate cyclase (GGDEF)-like protein/PAS domain S-box-containing protein